MLLSERQQAELFTPSVLIESAPLSLCFIVSHTYRFVNSFPKNSENLRELCDILEINRRICYNYFITFILAEGCFMTNSMDEQMKITLAEAEQLDLVPMKRLYKSAFPFVERKPFPMLMQLKKSGKAELLAAKNDAGDFCGMMITAVDGDYVLLDYFAVEPEKRGGGIGSQMLDRLRERYAGKKIFLEIERVESKQGDAVQKRRRKSFYMRSKMTETGVFSRLAGIEMEVLSVGCPITAEEYFAVHNRYEGLYAKIFIKPLQL